VLPEAWETVNLLLGEVLEDESLSGLGSSGLVLYTCEKRRRSAVW
jgi:hypothetical protein